MTGTELVLPTRDGPMPTYLATPAGDRRGAVLVVQEAFGLTDHILRLCDRLAADGWTAAAPALFHRSGAPVLGYDDRDSILPVMAKLDTDEIAADVDVCLGLLEGNGFTAESVGIVGFCMGGSVATATAARRPLGAAVSFYGGGLGAGRFGYPALIDLAAELQTPWLGLFGDRDQGIPTDQVEAMRAAAKGARVPTEVVRYPDADHGFNCEDRPSFYNPDAAADGWSRMLAWFGEHIGG